jgi:hypothetical protein
VGDLLWDLPAESVKNRRWMHVMFFAVVIAAGALVQVPFQRPSAPPEPRRVQMVQPRANQLQKMVPRNKIAGPAIGERGAGVPQRVRRGRRMKNGSK